MQQIVPSMIRSNGANHSIVKHDTVVLVASFDLNWNFVAFNNEYKNEFEGMFTNKLSPGLNLSDALDNYPKDREIILEGLKKAYEMGQFSEVRTIAKGDSIKIFEFTYTCLYADARKTGVTHIARDITEKAKTEKALREREERYHLLCKSTNDAIYEWNIQNDKFWWNDGIYTLFGYSQKELELTKNWWLDKVHSLYKEELKQKILNNIKNDISFWSYEYKFRKGDGSYASVVDRSYILYDDKWEAVRVIGAMMDVTEQKKAEEALIRREAQFSSLLENSSDIISIIDISSRYTYISPSVQKILGYTASELLNKNRRDYIHPEDLRSYEKTLKEVLTGEVVNTIQNRFRHKNGNYIYLESTYNNLIEDPSVDGIVINSRDVTDRMAAQNALRKSEAILKESQKIAKMGSWEFDVTTKEMIWSEELFEVFGRDIKDGVPPFEEILSSLTTEKVNVLRSAFTNAMEKGEGYNIDYSRILSDKIQHLNSICTSVRDHAGNVVKLRGIVMDISSRKETEEKLLESEEWFKTIFNTSRDGFVVELNEKIFFVNDAFVQLFGYPSRNEILGTSIIDIIADENIKTIAEYSQRRLKGEDIPNIYETKGKKKDGNVIDIEISASVFSIRGNKYIIASVRDITERKQAEKQLMEQNEELKKINSELDRFVYSASHDLRAPLVSVLGLTNILKINESDDEKIKYLDLVTKSIHKLDRFIQEIIHHSRNSRVEVKSEEVDFRKIIDGTFEDLRYLDEAKNIIVNVDVIGQDKFYSDSGRIAVLFNNLVSNAIRYSYPELRTPAVDIKVVINNEKAKIRISDNGLGIAEEHINRIFEMFYRASHKNVGSGLGLYIVKETLAKLGGEIQVYSTLGEGTTFEIILPNNKQEAHLEIV